MKNNNPEFVNLYKAIADEESLVLQYARKWHR